MPSVDVTFELTSDDLNQLKDCVCNTPDLVFEKNDE